MGWGVEADCQDESTHVGPQELGGRDRFSPRNLVSANAIRLRALQG